MRRQIRTCYSRHPHPPPSPLLLIIINEDPKLYICLYRQNTMNSRSSSSSPRSSSAAKPGPTPEYRRESRRKRRQSFVDSLPLPRLISSLSPKKLASLYVLLNPEKFVLLALVSKTHPLHHPHPLSSSSKTSQNSLFWWSFQRLILLIILILSPRFPRPPHPPSSSPSTSLFPMGFSFPKENIIRILRHHFKT